MAVFVNDTFSGEVSNVALTSHTGEVGGTWTVITSLVTLNVSATNDNVYKPTTSTAGNLASGTPATNEYDVEADITKTGTTSTSPGVVGRASTSAQTFYMARYNIAVGTEAWQLYKVNAGSFTLLGSYAQTLTLDQAYRVKLEIRDAAKKLYVDGVERVSSANDDITSAGKAGVRSAGSTNPGNSRIDNFTATDTATGGVSINLFPLFQTILQGEV